MYSRNVYILVVCLGVLLSIGATGSAAFDLKQAAFSQGQEDLYAPPVVVEAKAPPLAKPIVKVKPITKVKPEKMFRHRPDLAYGVAALPAAMPEQCILPIPRPKGWEVSGEAFFARTKGKIRAGMGYGGYFFAGGLPPEVDLNADLGIPDHNVVATISAVYRFRPRWSLRYSIMPMTVNGSGQTDNLFFGGQFFFGFQNSRVKWEHLYQRMGIVYDPIRSYSSRVSVFGEYVRIDDRVSSLSSFSQNFGSTTADNDMNMAMAGLEFEKCMKTGRICNTFSIECRAGVAFGDDGIGSDITTNLKYSIPLNNGRWGYVKGGYRFLTYKKKFSEVKSFDLAMDGAILQMGLVF